MQTIQQFLDYYVARGLLQSHGSPVWFQYSPTATLPNYKWKMHVAATDVADWERVARVIVPWLIQNKITFKTVQPTDYATGMILSASNAQYAKAFTIYPRNAAEFEYVARGLDALMRRPELQKLVAFAPEHNMAFERSLGASGRLFYRLGNTPDGKYMSARGAAAINPQNPFNPFNEPDPFANMFDDGVRAQFNAGRMRVEQIWHELQHLAACRNVANSSDGTGRSVYLVPLDENNRARIQELLAASGVKYDEHFSRAYGMRVFRFMPSEFATLTR